MQTSQIRAQITSDTQDYIHDSQVETSDINDGLAQLKPQEHQFEEGTNERLLFSLKRSTPKKITSTRSFIQPKLKIGSPNDKYEREADAIADLVIRRIELSKSSPTIQKKCDTCKKKKKLDKKIGKDNEIKIMRKPIVENYISTLNNYIQTKSNQTEGFASSSLESRLTASKGKGSTLPVKPKNEMESTFGVDFSQVKIHTNSEAIQMNKELDARAFTNGNNIFFNKGEYFPNSMEGKKLLAHELTHVVQQNGGGTSHSIKKNNTVNLQAQTKEENKPTSYQRVSTLIPLLIELEASGLFSPPYLPREVGQIPRIPMTEEEANHWVAMAPLIVANLASRTAATEVGISAGSSALEIAAARWGTAAVIEGSASSASILSRIALVSAEAAPPIAFFTILLWPSSTAPAWMDTIDPITGNPYGSPREYDWVGNLSSSQIDYLRYLTHARNSIPDPALDGETETREQSAPIPETSPAQEENEDSFNCKSRNISRKGGNSRHDTYATKVTGSEYDYNVIAPGGALSINFDGRSEPRLVWEVKVGFGWFFNPAKSSLRDLKLAEFDAQKNLGLFIASACEYSHFWSIPDRWVASLLNTRWGGVPQVLSIPE